MNFIEGYIWYRFYIKCKCWNSCILRNSHFTTLLLWRSSLINLDHVHSTLVLAGETKFVKFNLKLLSYGWDNFNLFDFPCVISTDSLRISICLTPKKEWFWHFKPHIFQGKSYIFCSANIVIQINSRANHLPLGNRENDMKAKTPILF